MEQVKPWYLSRTIWASLVAVAASAAAMLGIAVDDADAGALAERLAQAVAAVAAIVAILGRIAARSRIE